MIKIYRVWNHGFSLGYYVSGNSPKVAVRRFLMGDVHPYFPIHTILWKKEKDLNAPKMTKEGIKFRDYHGEDKYTKYGRKYYKKDLYPK